MNVKECKRQAVHFSGVLLALLTLRLDKTVTGGVAVSIALFLLFLSWWTNNKDKLRKKLPFRVKKWEKVEDETYEIMNSFERDEDLKQRPYKGAILFMLSIGLTFLVFPQSAAMLAVLVVSVSDSTSTLVGVHLGGRKLPHNKDKSLEGSSAFFLSSMIIALFFTSPLNSLLIAMVGSSVESLPRIDDNFSIPITVALVFLLL